MRFERLLTRNRFVPFIVILTSGDRFRSSIHIEWQSVNVTPSLFSANRSWRNSAFVRITIVVAQMSH